MSFSLGTAHGQQQMPSLTYLPGVTVTGHGQGTVLEFLPAWRTIVPETEVRRVDEAESPLQINMDVLPDRGQEKPLNRL